MIPVPAAPPVQKFGKFSRPFQAGEKRVVSKALAGADRGASPAQAVFLVGSERDGYHAGEPANDARFIAVFAHALEHAGGYAPEEARRAGTLLPDMLSYDPTRPASFPSNGRTLTDDAADAFLAVLTNGKVTGGEHPSHQEN